MKQVILFRRFFTIFLTISITTSISCSLAAVTPVDGEHETGSYSEKTGGKESDSSTRSGQQPPTGSSGYGTPPESTSSTPSGSAITTPTGESDQSGTTIPQQTGSGDTTGTSSSTPTGSGSGIVLEPGEHQGSRIVRTVAQDLQDPQTVSTVTVEELATYAKTNSQKLIELVTPEILSAMTPQQLEVLNNLIDQVSAGTRQMTSQNLANFFTNVSTSLAQAFAENKNTELITSISQLQTSAAQAYTIDLIQQINQGTYQQVQEQIDQITKNFSTQITNLDTQLSRQTLENQVNTLESFLASSTITTPLSSAVTNLTQTLETFTLLIAQPVQTISEQLKSTATPETLYQTLPTAILTALEQFLKPNSALTPQAITTALHELTKSSTSEAGTLITQLYTIFGKQPGATITYQDLVTSHDTISSQYAQDPTKVAQLSALITAVAQLLQNPLTKSVIDAYTIVHNRGLDETTEKVLQELLWTNDQENRVTSGTAQAQQRNQQLQQDFNTLEAQTYAQEINQINKQALQLQNQLAQTTPSIIEYVILKLKQLFGQVTLAWLATKNYMISPSIAQLQTLRTKLSTALGDLLETIETISNQSTTAQERIQNGADVAKLLVNLTNSNNQEIFVSLSQYQALKAYLQNTYGIVPDSTDTQLDTTIATKAGIINTYLRSWTKQVGRSTSN